MSQLGGEKSNLNPGPLAYIHVQCTHLTIELHVLRPDDWAIQSYTSRYPLAFTL